ncbi:hypothetical protein [Streptomyces sp. S.PB5]|uniref:hypothetical protein n=1 Tax=Streptomyces sp. S.PB5 TaxID=3020844 RepID=UPI0025B020DF|nr:hypothetical protein [Streptomyces sp. S.PB5]MDN3028256.1 hypothetical protein [Streptomyces sp. S.PB5]
MRDSRLPSLKAARRRSCTPSAVTGRGLAYGCPATCATARETTVDEAMAEIEKYRGFVRA